jgi:hypothetical protein
MPSNLPSINRIAQILGAGVGLQGKPQIDRGTQVQRDDPEVVHELNEREIEARTAGAAS